MDVVTLQSMVVRKSDIVFMNVEEDVVMLNVATSKYYGIRSVGRFIWEQLAEPIRVDAVCDILMKEYSVDRETCEKEVLAFLNHMRSEQLVFIVPDSGQPGSTE